MHCEQVLKANKDVSLQYKKDTIWCWNLLSNSLRKSEEPDAKVCAEKGVKFDRKKASKSARINLQGCLLDNAHLTNPSKDFYFFVCLQEITHTQDRDDMQASTQPVLHTLDVIVQACTCVNVYLALRWAARRNPAHCSRLDLARLWVPSCGCEK